MRTPLAVLLVTFETAQAASTERSNEIIADILSDAMLDRAFQGLQSRRASLENSTLQKAAGLVSAPKGSLASGRGELRPAAGLSALRPALRPSGTRTPNGRLQRAVVSELNGAAAVYAAPGAPASLIDIDCDTCRAQSEPFRGVDSSTKFKAAIHALVEAGKLPAQVQEGFAELADAYLQAMKSSPQAEADKEAALTLAMFAEGALLQFKDPYTFPSRHGRITKPFDYYCLGQRFFGNIIDFDRSFVGHADRLMEIQHAVARGENVLLLANHQSEGDPAVWAWMTEALSPSLATDIHLVAGDRVVLDPLAKPISMGRNLICVHSKRHMDDQPELKAEKMKTNQRSVREIGKLFKQGGALVWVAPSGGRDRKGPSGEYEPSSFDPAAVMTLKRMMDKSDKPGHVYPMAMVSADMMPPPDSVEKKLGEKRIINYHGVGISVGDEIDSASVTAGVDDKDAQTVAFSQAAHDKVKILYAELANAVYGRTQPPATFTQPWKQ